MFARAEVPASFILPQAAVSQNPYVKFEKIWRAKDQQGMRLLRMAGLVQMQDWNVFTEEEKTIILSAFNEEGRLTSFGFRLLQELVDSRLNDPNVYPQPPQAPKEEPKNQPGKDLTFLDKPGLSADAMKSGSDAIFAPARSGSLLLPYDWSRDTASSGKVSPSIVVQDPTEPSQEPSLPKTRIRILVTPRFAVTTDRYNIQSQEDVSVKAIKETGLPAEVLAKYGARIIHTLSVFNLVAIETDQDTVREFAMILQARGMIARPASQLTTALAPTAPPAPRKDEEESPSLSWAARLGAAKALCAVKPKVFQDQGRGGMFGAMLQDGVPMIRPSKFYEAGYHGESAVALIVDSGIDKLHPDFANRDITRVDLTDDKDDRDYVGHGTHVGSIAAGTGYGSEGVERGVAYKTGKILAAKVFGKSPFTTEDTILAGLNWGVKEAKGAKVVVNLSLGGRGTPNDILSRAVNQLSHMGHAVTIAAGNSGPFDGSVSSPGLGRDALTVGAVDKMAHVTRYSSRGDRSGYKTPAREKAVYSKPDVLMPGGDVDWELIDGQLSQSMEGKGERPCVYGPGILAAKSGDMSAGPCDVVVNGRPLYTRMAGTSMAAPHAAGAELLVFDYVNRNGGLRQSTALESYAAAREASVPLRDAEGNLYRGVDQGSGLMQLDRLYDLVSSRLSLGLPIGNMSASIATWVASSGSQKQLEELRKETNYRITRFGVVDTVTGDVVNSDEEMDGLKAAVEAVKKRGGLDRAIDWSSVRFKRVPPRG